MPPWLRRTALVLVALTVLFLALLHHEAILDLVRDQERLQAWLADLGPLGPLGLIAINAAQVVFAPIPGYFMQIAAGYLYGWLGGAIYGVVGMALGGILAMGLARIFGRPLVIRVVSEKRLARWEQVTHLNALPIWFLLMLGPFGDIPYFIAGLTSLAIWKIVAVAVFVRTPSVVVSAAIGAGIISWRSPWVIGGALLLMGTAVWAMFHQERIERFVDEKLLSRVVRRATEPPQPEGDEETPISDMSEADGTIN
jgi:uncharacterized membrane protein YdjX (TVP38/TMEM64 family)